MDKQEYLNNIQKAISIASEYFTKEELKEFTYLEICKLNLDKKELAKVKSKLRNLNKN